MKSWNEFLTMGGYAAYVWPAYGIAALVVVFNAISPVRRLKRRVADLKRRHAGGRP